MRADTGDLSRRHRWWNTASVGGPGGRVVGAFAGLLSLLLSGAGGAWASPASLPSIDLASPAGAAPSRLRDIPIPSRLSLREAMELTVAHHPQYRQAIHTAQANQEVIGEVYSNYLPHLSAGGGYNYETGNFVISPGIPVSFYSVLVPNSNNAYNFYQASFNLTQTVFTFGQRITQLRQAKYAYRASIDQAQWTLNNLLSGVETAYDTLAQDILLVDAAKKTEEDYRSQLAVAQAEYQIGMAAKFDVLNARVNLSNATLNLITAKNNVETARVGLNNAMGIESRAAYTVVTALSYTDFPADLDTMVDRAMKNRPDLTSALDTTEADIQNERYYESTYMPSIGMTGGYTYASMFFPLTYNWSAGVTLSVPIFSGFLTVHQERQAQKTTLAARDALENLRVNIRSAIRQDLYNLETARQRIRTTRDLEKQSEESLRLATGQYQVGVGSAVALTQAEADVAAARSQVVQAVYGYKMVRAALIRDAGMNPLAEVERRGNREGQGR